MAGRKTKLTPEVQERIVEALGAGNYQQIAAQYAGIAEPTYYRWLKRGEDERARIDAGEEPREREAKFVELLDAVDEAKAKSETQMLALIRRSAVNGQWQAAAWFLERSRPDRWGKREFREHSGPEGGPITLAGIAEMMGGDDDSDQDGS